MTFLSFLASFSPRSTYGRVQEQRCNMSWSSKQIRHGLLEEMPNCRKQFFGTRFCLRKLELSKLEEPLFQARHKQTSINHDGKDRVIRAGKTEISVDGGQLLSPGEGGTRVRRVGVLGGGQLARMMIYAAHRLNMSVAVLDPDPTAPGGITADRHVVGHFRDASAIHQLSQLSDVVTVEIEHVNAQGLRDIQRRGVAVNPAPSTLLLIQDKYRQKKAMADSGVPVGDFEETKSREAILAAGERLGYPLVLKAKRLAYDGRGNFVLQSSSEVDEAIEALTKDDDLDGEYGLYAEKYVPFSKELAVLVARNLQGEMVAYEPVQTIQRDNICHLVIAPAPVPKAVLSKAIEVGKSVVGCLEGAGLFAIELFLLPDNKTILFNEVAPRPHNSGHYSIEACSTSQFEQHLRAIAGLPLGDTSMKVGSAVMLNVVGDQDPMTSLNLVNAAMTAPRATIHWYGKAEQRPGRKMGHVTVTGATLAECADSLRRMGINLTEYSAVDMSPPEPEDKDRPAQVGVIMGSDSDLPTMRAAAEVLEQFNVPYELTIVSAHRTPQRMMEYASTAAKRGLKVIIAGAGGAAHLPGMVASMTPLPVIGVPVRTTGALDGQDALYSIVQMPKGVPVATVAIDNAMNAGLLAVRILGAADAKLSSRMAQYQTDMTNQVLGKVHTLQEVGWKGYGQNSKS